jgi:16S rRNA (cytosine967-C5)-methyltransferase
LNVRVLAWRILRAQVPRPQKLAAAVARRARLTGRERTLLFALVEHETRRRGTLRALVKHFGRGDADAGTSAHLALGFVQAFFMERIPERTLLIETRRAARLTLGERHGRFVFNVMKTALRARAKGHADDPLRDLVLRDASFALPVFHDPKVHALLWAEDALSLPVPLMKRWTKRLGDEAALQLARGALLAPDGSLFVARGSRDDVLAELEAMKISARPGEHARIVLVVPDHVARVRTSAAYAQGRVALLGETALRNVELAQPAPRERVLQLCAGTDTLSSSAQTAALALTGALVHAHDSSEKHGERRARELTRLGAVATRSAGESYVRAGDASAFDAVVLTAPSSDSGVLARFPAARWRFSPESQAAHTARQDALLDQAATHVRAGGRLVYATTSIEPEENQRRVRAFLERHSEFALDAEHAALPAERSRTGPMDGGYGARLVRR